MAELRFFAPGKPVPQGSMSVGRQGQVYHAKSKRLNEWRKEIICSAAQQAMRETDWPVGYDEAVSVSMMFRYHTKNHPEREFKTTAHDLDKLVRAVLDSLTFAQVVSDDSRVCQIDMTDKRWTRDPAKQGVLITVATLT